MYAIHLSLSSVPKKSVARIGEADKSVERINVEAFIVCIVVSSFEIGRQEEWLYKGFVFTVQHWIGQDSS